MDEAATFPVALPLDRPSMAHPTVQAPPLTPSADDPLELYIQSGSASPTGVLSHRRLGLVRTRPSTLARPREVEKRGHVEGETTALELMPCR